MSQLGLENYKFLTQSLCHKLAEEKKKRGVILAYAALIWQFSFKSAAYKGMTMLHRSAWGNHWAVPDPPPNFSDVRIWGPTILIAFSLTITSTLCSDLQGVKVGNSCSLLKPWMPLRKGSPKLCAGIPICTILYNPLYDSWLFTPLLSVAIQNCD